MGRIGFEAEQDLRQAVEEIAEVCQFPNLRCDGIFTHFASADRVQRGVDCLHPPAV